MSSSTMPRAVTALVTMAAGTVDTVSAELPGDNTLVVVDSYFTGNIPDYYIAIAMGDDEQPGVEFTGDIAGAATRSTPETYSVHCEASGWSGDGDPGPARTACMQIFDAFADSLGADPRLGRVVMQAYIEQAELIQTQDDKGSIATLPFVVYVKAFRTV